MKFFIIIILSISVLSCNTSTNKKESEGKTKISNPNWSSLDTYCNSRFGFCIDYPSKKFIPQPESQNGDGRIFLNKSGEEVLRVYGTMSMSTDGKDLTLRDQFNDDIRYIKNENGKITYKKLGTNYFVLSGFKNNKIFYQKTIMKEDAFGYAILQYNKNEKDDYSKIADLIFKSFE